MSHPAWVVLGGDLAEVLRPSRRGGADGYAVLRAGSAYSEFVQDWIAKPAEVGKTVCRFPRFSCYCGLTHITRERAAQAGLELDERCPGCGESGDGPHGPGVCV